MPYSSDDRRIQARQLYDLAGAGDWAAAEAMLTDDFVAVEAAPLPFAGTYSGKNGLRTLFERVMGMLDVAGLHIGDITGSEDHAIALVEFEFADGSRASLAEMFRFSGDQVCEIRPYYFDPAPVVAAVEAKRASLAAK